MSLYPFCETYSTFSNSIQNRLLFGVTEQLQNQFSMVVAGQVIEMRVQSVSPSSLVL